MSRSSDAFPTEARYEASVSVYIFSDDIHTYINIYVCASWYILSGSIPRI